MNNKTFGVILLAALLIGVVGAVVYETYLVPMQTIVEEKPIELEIWIDGKIWLDPQIIDWGTLTQGETKTKPIKVITLGLVEATLDMTDTLDPALGTLTWDLTNATPDIPAEGFLTLTIALDATPGSYDWIMEITAT